MSPPSESGKKPCQVNGIYFKFWLISTPINSKQRPAGMSLPSRAAERPGRAGRLTARANGPSAAGEQPRSLQAVVPRRLGELCDSLQDSQGSQATLVHSKRFNGFGGLSHRYHNSRQGGKRPPPSLPNNKIQQVPLHKMGCLDFHRRG